MFQAGNKICSTLLKKLIHLSLIKKKKKEQKEKNIDRAGKNIRLRMIKCWKGRQSEAEMQSPIFFLKYKNGKTKCIQCITERKNKNLASLTKTQSSENSTVCSALVCAGMVFA